MEKDLHLLFAGWDGYGEFLPAAQELLAKLAGRCDRVVMHTERTGFEVYFEVLVADPDVQAYESDEDLRVVWSCRVETKRGESQPSPYVVAAARDQQFVADRCVELLRVGS
jgi:hypothetical protein